jgi:hypothetical protein
MFLPERIIYGMDRSDNDNGLGPGQQIHSQLINWIFLPVPLAIAVIGLGILTGFFFKDNFLLQGPMKLIFGIALIIYGLVRSVMIINKIRGKRKNQWIEKS